MALRPPFALKREDTRLRDWNLCGSVNRRRTTSHLKREDTRLRDWNFVSLEYIRRDTRSWKEKILDYEIETPWNIRQRVNILFTWKEKILDYEIETDQSIAAPDQDSVLLEKRRYSITRLKLKFQSFSVLPEKTWKEKILDYEIETLKCLGQPTPTAHRLEKRRYSITRLKPSCSTSRKVAKLGLKREDTRLRDWNWSSSDIFAIAFWLEKRRYSITRLKRDRLSNASHHRFSLEKRRYSITRLKLHSQTSIAPTTLGSWKEKILDYEIETTNQGQSPAQWVFDLKREDTRLRDWNSEFGVPQIVTDSLLEKRRYSITRLKLQDANSTSRHDPKLEKRRYSITRLKRRIARQLMGGVDALEKRRYSITRLKRSETPSHAKRGFRCLKREDTRLRDWNKN